MIFYLNTFMNCYEKKLKPFFPTVAQFFFKAQHLSLHERTAHAYGEQSERHECVQFETKYSQRFNEIERVQSNKRKYICKICNNVFRGHSQLSAHKRLHREKRYKCPYCEKSYPRQADLNIHIRSHTGELPFACHLCEKRFAIKVRLTYHLQRHEGVTHPCSYCNAVYDNRNKLKEHMFKHTGMPYICELCPGIGFSRRLRFANHMKRTHQRVMTEEELAAIFAKNTGKTVYFKSANKSGDCELQCSS